MNSRLPTRLAASRRLVLAAAVIAGLVAAAIASPDHPRAHGVHRVVVVADAAAADAVIVAQAAEPKAEPKAEAKAEAKAEPKAEAKPKPDAATPASPSAAHGGVDAEISIGEKGVTVKRRRPDRDAEVTADVQIDEFDSFEQFVERAPWLAGLVFMVTALFFLVPLIVIILVVWYKMRSNRLRNETLLKLAERGVPPVVAMEAVAGAPAAAAALDSVPPSTPLYEQARQVRKSAAWSDLRKAVILGGIGLGLVVWSMLDDGTPNGFGLVLLFVGIGYGILWHFEDRQTASRTTPPGDPRGGA